MWAVALGCMSGVSKTKVAAYILGILVYALSVGLASSYSVVLGVVVLAVPLLFLAYKFFGGRMGAELSVPILRLRKNYASSFYTDAPEMDVRYAVSLGEELGVKAKAVLTRIPNTEIQAHKIIVYTSNIAEKAAKQNLSFALRSMVSLLKLKGYKIISDTSIDESILVDEGRFKPQFPIVVVSTEEDYGSSVAKASEFTETFVLLTCQRAHLAKALGALSGQDAAGYPVLRFGYNFGFTLLDQDLDSGFFADVAQVCFGLTAESTAVLASVLSRTKKEDQNMNVFLLADMLEAEAASHGLSPKVHDELYAFHESLKAGGVWRSTVKDHPPSDRLPKRAIIDLSTIPSPQATRFMAYMVSKKLVDRGVTVILDLTGLSDLVVAHALNDVRLTHNTVFILLKSMLRKDLHKSFGTLVYLGADEELRRIVEGLGVPPQSVQDNASYIVGRSGSLTPFTKSSSKNTFSNADIERLVNNSAPPLDVEDTTEKPYLLTVVGEQYVDALVAALGYVEKYAVVEETTFNQALGLKAQSTQITSKLIRLGYLKRRRKSGILFVELTARGYEELEKLRSYVNKEPKPQA